MRAVRRVQHFLFAHKGNRYEPGLFARQTVSVVALLLLLIEGVYLVQVHIVLRNGGFLATVLPAALTTLTNADRAAQGEPALLEDPELDKIAQAKADDMAAKGYFAHVSPDGKTPWDFLGDAGYPYTYAGENLAVDFTESSDVETAWMNSPMHRANILKQEYTRVGIGVAQGMYEGHETTFVAQYFAARRGDGAAAAVAPAVREVSAADTPATTPVETAKPARVLGASVAAQPSEKEASPIAVAATSPSRDMRWLIVAFTAFVAIFFSLTLFVHSRRKLLRLEIIGGGVAFIALAGLLLVFNGSAPAVPMPTDTQAASVAAAL